MITLLKDTCGYKDWSIINRDIRSILHVGGLYKLSHAQNISYKTKHPLLAGTVRMPAFDLPKSLVIFVTEIEYVDDNQINFYFLYNKNCYDISITKYNYSGVELIVL